MHLARNAVFEASRIAPDVRQIGTMAPPTYSVVAANKPLIAAVTVNPLCYSVVLPEPNLTNERFPS